MAEANKSGILAKAQKRISRTKTKVLQTLGKAEKYTDETFDDLVLKTEKQHEVAHHLQKELKSYLHCMRTLSNASKSLAAALSHTYEEDWTDEIGFKKQLEVQDLLWTDYMETMQSTVMEPMNAYLASFPPLKVRTAKRGRKMMDFDNARHNLEVLQAAKKKDEAKITKAQEDLNESKQIFDELHSELCTELPNFYNSRVTYYADLFQKLFNCENRLHSELARISKDLTDTSEKLSKDHVQFVYTPKRPLSKSLSDNVRSVENSKFYYCSDEQPLNGDSSPRPGTDSPASSASPAATPTTPTARPRTSAAPAAASSGGGAAVGGAGVGGAAAAAVAQDGEEKDEDDCEHLYGNQDAVRAAAKVNGDVECEPKSQAQAGKSTVNGPGDSPRVSEGDNVYEAPPQAGHKGDQVSDHDDDDDDDDDDDEGDVYHSPPSNKPVCEPPPSTLYQVEATHAYNGEDIDELSFDPGDIIYVVPFDNAEEQDDGWQMGIKQRDGLKGVFPENFTRRL